MTKTLIGKCQEIATNSLYPFQEKNLTTTKIFNDLVEFHNLLSVNNGGKNGSTGIEEREFLVGSPGMYS